MALKITQSQIAAIEAHGARDYPGECCGVLVGLVQGDDKIVESVAPLGNIHEDGVARRFRIDPMEMYRLERVARNRSQAVIGIYHSHPDHPADPSEYDREHAWPVFSYMIVSVRSAAAQEMKSWVLADDRSGFIAEAVEVAPG